MTDLEIDPNVQRKAVSLLQRGLVTLAEAARLSGASRQRVEYWAREIDLKARRQAVLKRLWRA
jgi:predicted HTH domain antitoxin